MAGTFAKKADRAVAILILTLTSVSCDSAVSPPPNVRVTLTPALAGSFASLGGTHAFQAVVTDTLDNALDTPVDWSINPQTSQVTITPEGVVTVGTAATSRDYSVRATAGGVTAGAIVRVLPRPAGMLVFSSGGQMFVKDFGDDQDAQQITTLPAGTIAGIGVEAGSSTVFFGFGNLPNSDIYKVNVDGSGLLNLTNDVASQNQGPTVNPVSHEVFFSRRISGVTQIFRMEPSGVGITQVSVGTQSKLVPSVSPDGLLLSWSEFYPGFNSEVVVAAIQGTNAVRFTDRTGNDGSASWESPTRLYWSRGEGSGGNLQFDVVAADVPGGGNLVNLTQTATASENGASRACVTNSVTYLRNGEAYHLDIATGLVVKYTLPAINNMTFARRLCP
jgi:hypothetical protein